jgi:hypothetical protein
MSNIANKPMLRAYSIVSVRKLLPKQRSATVFSFTQRNFFIPTTITAAKITTSCPHKNQEPRMHFSKKIFAQVGIALSLAFASSVAQAGVVTYTMSGTIGVGLDQLAIFGAPTNALDGQHYTQTITTDLIGMKNGSYNPGWNRLTNDINGHQFSGVTSVNGQNFTWSVQANNAAVYMLQLHTLGFPNGNDQMGISLSGANTFTSDGYMFNAINAVTSNQVSFMSNINMDQNHSVDLSTPGINPYSFFRLERDGQVTYFTGRPDSLTWTAAAVPEPETYALMLLGLAGLALAAKRKKLGAVA